mmetsp:Transcript_65142/g.165138  ORF Transcript_65142/g.165138 Transcript_65142/m.165138 type:complete len:80 (+) Transcript_65142:32-271(+)
MSIALRCGLADGNECAVDVGLFGHTAGCLTTRRPYARHSMDCTVAFVGACTFCVHMALHLVPPNRSIDLCAYRLGGIAK